MADLLSICVCSRFYPNVGGVETVAEQLANRWTARGHRVVMITDVPANAGPPRTFPYEIVHCPSPASLLRRVRRCDVFVHNNISLKVLWPLAIVRRPLVAVHHGPYFSGATPGLRARLKLRVARRAACNVSVSDAMRQHIGAGGIVIGNPYANDRFREVNGRRDRQIVFLGRLVSDKGADVLLRAMVRLRSAGVRASATIIGDGPERPRLEAFVRDNDLRSHVTFHGKASDEELPGILNQHVVMVIPSTYEEGFGVVALEGIACGLVAVGSNIGGLPDAIGRCGETFPLGDDRSLADLLSRLLPDQERLARYRTEAADHLARHHPDVVANRYIECFREAISSDRAPCQRKS
jgi:glycosyltransferase involved in cell wall biosynthesis